jgi:twitching motility protein PilT
MSMTDEPLRLPGASSGADRVELHTILRTAVEQGASDVHLKVGQPPIIRFDGDLEPLQGWTPLAMPALEGVLDDVARSSPARAAAFEQTGELDTAYQAIGLPRFRVNAFRQRGDISFAFRVIPREIPDFARLGLPPGVARLAEERRGLVLVTGATGAGKTTTLAAVTTRAASSTSARSVSTRSRSTRRCAARSDRTRTSS